MTVGLKLYGAWIATSTENDRQELIDEAIRRGDIKLAPASEKHVKMANDVQNDFYNKLIGLGMNEQEALSTSILIKKLFLQNVLKIGTTKSLWLMYNNTRMRKREMG